MLRPPVPDRLPPLRVPGRLLPRAAGAGLDRSPFCQLKRSLVNRVSKRNVEFADYFARLADIKGNTNIAYGCRMLSQLMSQRLKSGITTIHTAHVELLEPRVVLSEDGRIVTRRATAARRITAAAVSSQLVSMPRRVSGRVMAGI